MTTAEKNSRSQPAWNAAMQQVRDDLAGERCPSCGGSHLSVSDFGSVVKTFCYGCYRTSQAVYSRSRQPGDPR